ncbi:hypothetical protein JANAI62_34160 [Jannaschia pagri]|uniref:Inner membrane protein n=1 Tax=Jannaschia pagri TaxID=2829797 RepID=A0ABQ4NQV7_9RHOB|nr:MULTISPECIES: hypothetical protein [unclassified Jannaschia]GIT92958.1 hypothetical protein JANAI61_34160 [Jannaschia sp. AI_61]GIT96793.1 hypothetical protein JANAI62_34160 [Jannaschia sp. AI_62]
MARKSKKNTRTSKPDVDQQEVDTTAVETPPEDVAEDTATVEDAIIVSEAGGEDQSVPDSPPTEDQANALDGSDAGTEAASEGEASTPEEVTPEGGATEDTPPADLPDDTVEADPAETKDADVEAPSDAEAQPDQDADAEASRDDDQTAPPQAEQEPVGSPSPVLAPTPAPQVIEKRGPGFVPLVLGGLIAGAIGYAIPLFTASDASGDDGRIAALEAEVAAIEVPEAVDLGALEAAQADLSARLDALTARVDGLTVVPASSDGDVAAAPAVIDLSGIEAGLAELEDLPEALSALEARIDALPQPGPDLSDRVAEVEARLDALRDETQAVEATAEDLAREAARNQLKIAIDSGAPFAEPLAVLGDAPEVLTANAETGVATARTLADAFPEAARAALTEARRVEPVDGNPITAFLRRQTGARSLEPQEGTSADAVLSRAEAAVRAGDVQTALDEIAALPAEASAPLADWTAQAETLVAAQAAVQDYFETE